LPVSAIMPEQQIVTIEGLSPDGSHPVQKAWLALDVPQCGYCQAGMIMAAASLIAQNPDPTDADIDAEITNICRCGTYNRVRAAIKLAAAGSTTTNG
jgi:isoquinoline 1-oxidoreductase alpha subunit